MPLFYGRFVTRRLAPFAPWSAVLLLLGLLALARPVDHDESQYVAAAVLAGGRLPYRDFAYLQTPLQPLLFAPIAWLAGGGAWIALRLANAVLGALTLLLVARAARAAGATPAMALAAALLMGACDIFLFSAAAARNDMLPAALLSGALVAVLAPSTRGRALLAGLLLAGAAAAKLSYAAPALAYGAYALADRARRPLWLALGALPVALLVGALAAAAPEAFAFEVIRFPHAGPADWYARANPAKLTLVAKALDAVKFMALGPALLALWFGWRGRSPVLVLFLLAGALASLAPFPTWRQYLLPLLPPLFIQLARAWSAVPPGRALRIGTAIFVGAGLSVSAEAVIGGARQGLAMHRAARESAAIGAAWRGAGAEGPVATLSPHYLPAAGLAIDPLFAAGPFYFRGEGLLGPAAEGRLHLLSAARVANAPLGPILTGAEPQGDPALVAAAHARRYRAVPVHGTRFTLWLPPKPLARAREAS